MLKKIRTNVQKSYLHLFEQGFFIFSMQNNGEKYRTLNGVYWSNIHPLGQKLSIHPQNLHGSIRRSKSVLFFT